MRSLAKFFVSLFLVVFLASLFFFKNDFYRFFSFLGENLGLDRPSAENLVAKNRELSAENERLRILISENEIEESSSSSLRMARIYSRYPFADRSVLFVNQGSDNGIGKGMPVLSAKGILLGKVIKVKKSFSEIQTIFDPAWRSSVGIGSQKTKALLIGGSIPILDLIEPTAVVNNEDSVINLSPDFPYGLAIGKLIDLQKPLAQPWFKAELEPLSDISVLKEVWVDFGFKD